MATGKIKWFNPTKGYGFIENDAGGKDVFLHISALEEAGIDTLQEGEAVSFEIGEIFFLENFIRFSKLLPLPEIKTAVLVFLRPINFFIQFNFVFT